MGFHKRKRRFQRPPRNAASPIDRCNLHEWTGSFGAPAHNRKAMQLCRQVEQTLHLALAGCADPILQELLVLHVQPFPDSSRLLAIVQAESQPQVVHERLRAAGGILRREVAAGIHRRKTPELIFQVISTRQEVPREPNRDRPRN
jgi:ribosome-binding factor A